MLIGRGSEAEHHPVRRPEVTVGRGDDNDVVLGDPSVSERHARLRLAAGVWTLADLGSVNGSWVDGEAVQEELPLASGCSIRLGGTELGFSAHDRWEDSPPPRARTEYFLTTDTSSRRSPTLVLVGAGILLLALAGWLLTRVA